MPDTTTVRPGQVWADNDWRAEGRTLRVEAIQDGKAICTILTNPTSIQERLDRPSQADPWVRDVRNKQTRIRLDRFRPTSTGYRLVQDAEATDA
jgi:hypothetical protein